MLHDLKNPLPRLGAIAAAGVTILDLDRTLTRYGTYSPFLVRAAARTAP